MVEEFHLAVDTRPQDPGAGVFKSECGGRDVFYRNASKRGHVPTYFGSKYRLPSTSIDVVNLMMKIWSAHLPASPLCLCTDGSCFSKETLSQKVSHYCHLERI